MNTASNLVNEDSVRSALREVYDPEFGVSVEDLGLIYDVAIEGAKITVSMSLTSKHCPAGDVMMEGVRSAVLQLPGVTDAQVCLVWEPTWNPEMLSARAREQLGWDPAS